MARSSDNSSERNTADAGRDQRQRSTGADDLTRLQADFDEMKLLPWSEIWRSLSVAKIRGNGRMIEVFYDALFNDAVFDDRGAWSIETQKSH